MIDNAVLGISVVGGIALLSGVLILIGAVAMTKFQRVYEAAILRTLGASTRLLTATLALEYCALGLLAGTIGAPGARVELGRDPLRVRHSLASGARPACGRRAPDGAARRASIGVLASADVLRKKPLATLARRMTSSAGRRTSRGDRLVTRTRRLR